MISTTVKKAEPEQSPFEKTKSLALSMLNRRPLSEWELREKLKEKGCAGEDIDEVVTLFVGYGFLNDGEYAALVARRCAANAYGPGRLRAELKKRGVPETYWDEARAQLGSPDDTLDRLLAIRLRGKDPADRKERDKAAAALFRKGYSWEDIRGALNRMEES